MKYDSINLATNFFDCISGIVCLNKNNQIKLNNLLYLSKLFIDINIQIIDSYDNNIIKDINKIFNNLDNESIIDLLNNLKVINYVKLDKFIKLTDYYLCIINNRCIDQIKIISNLYYINNITLSTIIKSKLDKNIDFDVLFFNNSLDWYIIKKSVYKKINSIIHYSDKLQNIILYDKNISNFSEYILKSVITTNYDYNEEKLNIKEKSNFIINNYLKEIVLIQHYYKSNDIERETEINNVLQLNLLNPYISKIYLLNEKIYNFNKFDKLSKKIIQYNINKSITFADLFNFAKEQDKIVIFANLDIEICLDIKKLNSYRFDNIVYCLTRHNIHYSKSKKLIKIKNFKKTNNNEYMFSQDAWIFKPLLLKNFDTTNLNFLYHFCNYDNILITELNKQEIDTFNIPSDIKIIHHNKNIKKKILSNYPIMPLYATKYKLINKLLKLKIKYNLSSIQLNYFIKLCNILSLKKYEYEKYLNKLLGNAIISIDDLNFINSNNLYEQYINCFNEYYFLNKNNIESIFLLTTEKEYDNGYLFNFFDKLKNFIPSKKNNKIKLIIFFNNKIKNTKIKLLFNKILNNKILNNYFDYEINELDILPIDDVYYKEYSKDIVIPRYGLSSGPNILFFKAIKYKLDLYKIILLLETDTFFIKDYWLDILNNSIATKNFYICGSRYIFSKYSKNKIFKEHLNGVAIYNRTPEFINIINKTDEYILKYIKQKKNIICNYDMALTQVIKNLNLESKLFDIDEILNISHDNNKNLTYSEYIKFKKNIVLVHKK